MSTSVTCIFRLGDVGLLFMLECKLFCSGVKHGLIIGGEDEKIC